MKEAAALRWADAVSTEGSYGEWRYLIAHDVPSIPTLVDEVAGEAWECGSP